MYLSTTTVTNISQSYTYKMAAKSTGTDMEQNYITVTLFIILCKQIMVWH